MPALLGLAIGFAIAGGFWDGFTDEAMNQQKSNSVLIAKCEALLSRNQKCILVAQPEEQG